MDWRPGNQIQKTRRILPGGRLRLLWLGVLVWSAVAVAQPPVEWGEPRWVGLGNRGRMAGYTWLFGDTVVVLSRYEGDFGLLACTSHDGGATFGPFSEPFRHGQYEGTNVTISQDSLGRLVAFVVALNWDGMYWLQTSSDGGLSWGPPQQARIGSDAAGTVAGADYYRVDSRLRTDSTRYVALSHSPNAGQTWLPVQTLDLAPLFVLAIGTLAVTPARVISLAEDGLMGGVGHPVLVTSFPRQGGGPSPYQELPGQPTGSWLREAKVFADPTSETAIVLLALFTEGMDPFGCRLGWLVRTTDGGQTWEPPQEFVDGPNLYSEGHFLFQSGRRWGVYWADIRGPLRTLYFRLSANGGKSWYAKQTVLENIPGGGQMTGQFRGNQIRLFWASQTDTSMQNRVVDLRTLTGTLVPDTLPPLLFDAAILDTAYAGGEMVRMMAAGEDEDSLWQVQAVLRRADSADSVIVDLVRNAQEPTVYEASWTVPLDTADYSYYYRLEDMWEHVTYYPAEGPQNPYRTHIGPPLATDPDVIVHPSAFSLSAFPNPFNSTTVIRYSVPRSGPVSLTVYDLLGREVAVLVNKRRQAGEQRIVWEAGELPSGVYLVRLEAGGDVRVGKVMLLK